MNIILLEQQDFLDLAEDQNTLDIDFFQTTTLHARIHGDAFVHCRKVLKTELGDTLKVGLINGLLGEAKVTNQFSDHFLVEVNLNQAPPKKLPIGVIIALPRPQALKRILQNLSEVGIAEIVFIHANKVEKSYWQSPLLNQMEQYLRLGLSQSKDTVIPRIQMFNRFKSFVEDEFSSLTSSHTSETTSIIAHPYVSEPFDAKQFQDAPFKWLVIGPEGGFTEYELDQFIDAGAIAKHLGHRIYRVENALNLMIHQLS